MTEFYLDHNKKKFRESLENALKGLSRVLDVGRGRNWGEDMVNSYGITQEKETITVDVRSEPHPHCVGELSNLPFDDQCFGVVICESVLEHVSPVSKLDDTAEEIRRILIDNGVLVGWVPYCYHYHAGDFPDGNRFTHNGIERLFDEFRDVIIERCGGPFSVFLNALLQHRDRWVNRRLIERLETRFEYTILSRIVHNYRDRQPHAFNGVGYRFFAVK